MFFSERTISQHLELKAIKSWSIKVDFVAVLVSAVLHFFVCFLLTFFVTRFDLQWKRCTSWDINELSFNTLRQIKKISLPQLEDASSFASNWLPSGKKAIEDLQYRLLYHHLLAHHATHKACTNTRRTPYHICTRLVSYRIVDLFPQAAFTQLKSFTIKFPDKDRFWSLL